VNNKLVRIKTNRSDSIEAISQHRVEGMRNPRKTSVMVSSVQAETRTGHLSKQVYSATWSVDSAKFDTQIYLFLKEFAASPQNIYREVFQDWTPVYLIGR
jgi:hypothetical protein